MQYLSRRGPAGNPTCSASELLNQMTNKLGRTILSVSVLVAATHLLAAGGEAPHGEIVWDTFGVPHVFARNETGLFYGFGWAQAQSHGNLILHLFGEPADGRRNTGAASSNSRMSG